MIFLYTVHVKVFTVIFRDVTMNHEPVENWFKYVTFQIGWDAKQIAIQLE